MDLKQALLSKITPALSLFNWNTPSIILDPKTRKQPLLDLTMSLNQSKWFVLAVNEAVNVAFLWSPTGFLL